MILDRYKGKSWLVGHKVKVCVGRVGNWERGRGEDYTLANCLSNFKLITCNNGNIGIY